MIKTRLGNILELNFNLTVETFLLYSECVMNEFSPGV